MLRAGWQSIIWCSVVQQCGSSKEVPCLRYSCGLSLCEISVFSFSCYPTPLALHPVYPTTVCLLVYLSSFLLFRLLSSGIITLTILVILSHSISLSLSLRLNRCPFLGNFIHFFIQLRLIVFSASKIYSLSLPLSHFLYLFLSISTLSLSLSLFLCHTLFLLLFLKVYLSLQPFFF